jgi:hypothetical protein
MIDEPMPETSSMPLYKYVPTETLKNILEGTIRFTQPSAFNDPFELLPEVIIPEGEPERRINVSFDVMAPRAARSDNAVESIPDGCTSSDLMSRDIVQQLNQSVGILCLSRARDSLPMWAHYGDQYTGAVVEFDSTHEAFAGYFDVEYRSTRPRWHLRRYTTGEPIALAELCVKSCHWEYEKEVRLARPLAECDQRGTDGRNFPVYVRQLPLLAIKSVILGERMPVDEQRDIFGRVMNTHIALFLAAVSHAGYEFREERIKFGVPVSQMRPMVSPRTAHIFSDAGGQFGELARWMRDHHPLSKVVNRPV